LPATDPNFPIPDIKPELIFPADLDTLLPKDEPALLIPLNLPVPALLIPLNLSDVDFLNPLNLSVPSLLMPLNLPVPILFNSFNLPVALVLNFCNLDDLLLEDFVLLLVLSFLLLDLLPSRSKSKSSNA